MSLVPKSAASVLATLVLFTPLLIVGCATTTTTTSTTPTPNKSDTPAANLKIGLDTLLREHVVLLSTATSAALGARNDEYNEAYKALDANSQELAGAFTQIYGNDAHDTFLNLWRNHIGYFIDYTQGVTVNDLSKKDKALTQLVTFAQDFGAFIDQQSAGRLKKDAVAELIKTNVVELRGVIDAQAAKDFATAFTKERDSERQIESLGNILAGAIVDQFPDKY